LLSRSAEIAAGQPALAAGGGLLEPRCAAADGE
jgi:hypothetical protein